MTDQTKRFDAVLFDLDGTLTDPFPGITRSIQYALERMGAPVPEAKLLRWCIGPPLSDSFAVLLDTEDKATLDRAVELYRERYTVTGLFECTVIEGIEDVLKSLKASGHKLFLATSKPHTSAKRVLEHFGLLSYFDVAYGSEWDGTRSDKAELISYVLTEEGLAPERAAMVGDRKYDIIGARANHVAVAGVMWGYGSREELQGEGATVIVEKPVELEHWLVDGTVTADA